MKTITDGASLTHVLNSNIDERIRALLKQRFEQLDEDLTDANFAIVETGDTPDSIEHELGLSLFHDDGFRPDWVEAHGYCFEAAFDLTASFTQVLLIPADSAIDSVILEFCTASQTR